MEPCLGRWSGEWLPRSSDHHTDPVRCSDWTRSEGRIQRAAGWSELLCCSATQWRTSHNATEQERLCRLILDILKHYYIFILARFDLMGEGGGTFYCILSFTCRPFMGIGKTSEGKNGSNPKRFQQRSELFSSFQDSTFLKTWSHTQMKVWCRELLCHSGCSCSSSVSSKRSGCDGASWKVSSILWRMFLEAGGQDGICSFVVMLNCSFLDPGCWWRSEFIWSYPPEADPLLWRVSPVSCSSFDFSSWEERFEWVMNSPSSMTSLMVNQTGGIYQP